MFITIFVLFSLITEAVLEVTLEQNYLSITKEKGKTANIICKVTELSRDYVHWYHKKD
ncbi:T-cell receptor gamma, partial [Clarias magur]